MAWIGSVTDLVGDGAEEFLRKIYFVNVREVRSEAGRRRPTFPENVPKMARKLTEARAASS